MKDLLNEKERRNRILFTSEKNKNGYFAYYSVIQGCCTSSDIHREAFKNIIDIFKPKTLKSFCIALKWGCCYG